MEPEEKELLKKNLEVSEEEKELLQKNLVVSEENNRILKEMEKHARWGRIFSIVRVVIIILPFILGFLYLMPFLERLNDFYSGFGGGGASSGSGTSTDAIFNFWSELKRNF
jgi:hypothetical protein